MVTNMLAIDWKNSGLPADERLPKAAALVEAFGQARSFNPKRLAEWAILAKSEEPRTVELVCADLLSNAARFAAMSSRPEGKAFRRAEFQQAVRADLGPDIADLTDELLGNNPFSSQMNTVNQRVLTLARVIETLQNDNEHVLQPFGVSTEDYKDLNPALLAIGLAETGGSLKNLVLDDCDRHAEDCKAVFDRCAGVTSVRLEELFTQVYKDNRALSEMKKFESGSQSTGAKPS